MTLSREDPSLLTRQIFLCYAKEDKDNVDEIYTALREAGLTPWMDKPPKPFNLDGIRPGQLWDDEIRKNISKSSYLLAFLSRTSVAKRGYVQREYRLAIDHMVKMPHRQVFVIPVLLEHDCPLPEVSVDTLRFDQLQWFDLQSDGMETLIQLLKGYIHPDSQTVSSGEAQEIRVSSSESFIKSISSDTVVNIASGYYFLKPEILSGNFPGSVYLERVFDGWQFVIRNVNNLTIIGAAGDPTGLLVSPRYAFVLSFQNCSNIVLSNLTLGHAPDGSCQGGVVKFDSCRKIEFRNCDLFGSGTIGLELRQVEDMMMTDCCVRDCTYGIMSVQQSQDLRFRRTRFKHNSQFYGIQIEGSHNLIFEDCEMEDNNVSGSALFGIASDSSASWVGGNIRQNYASALVDNPERLDIRNAILADNRFRG